MQGVVADPVGHNERRSVGPQEGGRHVGPEKRADGVDSRRRWATAAGRCPWTASASTWRRRPAEARQRQSGQATVPNRGGLHGMAFRAGTRARYPLRVNRTR